MAFVVDSKQTHDDDDEQAALTLTDLVKLRGWQPSAKRLKHIAAYVCHFYLQWKPCSTLSSPDAALVLYEPCAFPFINAMLDQYATWFHYDGKPTVKATKTGKKKKNDDDNDDDD